MGWIAYPIAILLEVALTAGLVALQPYIPLGAHAILYVATIMAVAYWLGDWPAVVAFVLGLLAFAYYFLPPHGLIWPPAQDARGWAMFASFLIGTAFVALAMMLIRRAQRRAEAITDALVESGRRQELVARVLLELNRQGVENGSPQAILTLIKDYAEVDAAGILIREGGDFPYFVSQGFSADFIERENYLCAHTASGGVLLESATEQELGTSIRGRCLAEGYESIAIVPLRTGGELLGLIHLCDRRRGRFTPELIRFLEEIGTSIGIALARKQSERLLRESEQRMRALTEASFEGIVLNESGTVLEVNQQMADMLGYEPADLIGRSIPDLVDPEERARAEARISGGVQGTEEYHLVCKDRSLIDVEIRSKLIEYRGRSVRVTAVRDITERKHAEAALSKSEERLRLAQSTAKVVTWEWVPKSGEVTLPAEWYELYGLTTALSAYEDWRKLIHPDDIARLEADRQEAISGHRPFDIEFRILHGSGEVRWINVKGGAIYDESGEVVRVLGVDADITDRKRAEEVLHRYRLLSERSRDIVLFVRRADGRIIEANNAALDAYGYTRDELLAMTIYDLRGPEARPEVESQIAAGDAGSAAFETMHVRKDGSAFPVEVGTQGASIGGERVLMSIIRDITERRRADEEIRESRELLARQLSLLQEALVPGAPAADVGYDTAAVYRPAYPGEQIGGDFYDVFKTENGRLGAVIGDVSGKGIAAAAMAASARSTIHSFAYELSDPGLVLAHANTVLEPQGVEAARFVTVFLILINPPTGTLTYSRAGHVPAAVWRTDGSVDFLEYGNPPVGLLPGQHYETLVDRLGPGDKLILYTDGILEARRDGTGFFEIEGIREALVGCGCLSPQEVADSLLAAANDWARGDLRDDIAILVIERTGGR